LAAYFYDKEDFTKAFDNYTLAYTNFPNDYAASVYMFNAAMAQEEIGDADKAIEILEEIVSQFKSNDIDVADFSADVPEALFNLGRLYEAQGNLEKAVEKYEILVAEYQSYNLSNLAKTRLLTLK
jgi:tetratricopeptide (TPR) repeat protein